MRYLAWMLVLAIGCRTAQHRTHYRPETTGSIHLEHDIATDKSKVVAKMEFKL